MNKVDVIHKTYVKSHNNSNILIARYTYTLIIFTILSLVINVIIGNDIKPIIKSIIAALVFTSLITYIINVIKKEYTIKRIFVEDSAIAIGLILGLFPCSNLIILLIAIIVTLTIKNLAKDNNLSATLYGLLIITAYITYNLLSYDLMPSTPLMYLYQNHYDISFAELLTYGGGASNYLFGIYYLSPLLSAIVFGYLFYKKSIKYNIVIYYILTIFLIMLVFGALKGCIWLPFYELTSSGLLFLTIYALADYKNSPTIGETQLIYGLSLGIITVILKFMIPHFAVIIAMILGTLLLVKPLDKLSYKIKYNKKLYNIILITLLIFIILISIILSLIF